MITFTTVTDNPQHWQIVQVLLGELFDYDHHLRPERQETATIITGGLRHIQENIRDASGIALLMWDDTQPIGFATAWVTLGDGLDKGDNRIGYFSDAYIIPAYRGRGLYKELVARRIEHFQKLGIKKVALESLATNHTMHKTLGAIGFHPHKILFEKEI